MNKNLYKIYLSIMAVVIGIIVGSIIMFATGYNPFVAFSSLVVATFGSIDKTGQWITFSIPLVLCGLSIAFAYKTGLFNIGAEGQFLVGSISAVYVGSMFELPMGIHLIVTILSGMVAGMIWGCIPGILKAFFGVSEVVVTIMMNWIALFGINAFIESVFHVGSKIHETPTILKSASLKSEFLTNLLSTSKINFGIIILVIAIIIFWFILNKTNFGFEIKAVGFSPFCANYAGINSKSRIVYTMVIAGGFAGVAGAIYALGEPGYLTTISSFRNFGYDGIAVAMLGQLSPIGILLSGFILGALRSGAAYMTGVPTQIVDIMIGIILLFSALGTVFSDKLIRIFEKKNNKKVGD